MPTRIELINRALQRMGNQAIAESDPGAATHIAVYESVVEDLLSRNPWSFATDLRQLNRLTATPGARWNYYYQLPADMIGSPRAVYDSCERTRAFLLYELSMNRLMTNAEEIWLSYLRRPDPTFWPGYFVELVVKAQMAELALSIREDRVLHGQLRDQVYGPDAMMGQGGLLGSAMALDSQGKPSPVPAEGVNPLIDVRTDGPVYSHDWRA